MAHWVNSYCPLLVSPGGKINYCFLMPEMIVNPTGEISGDYCKVIYSATRTFTGWVYKKFIEEIIDEFPRGAVPVENPTVSEQDGAQYIMYLNQVQVNLCGEFVAAWMFHETSIETFLEKMKTAAPNTYKSIFAGGRARGTSAEEIAAMVMKLYGGSVTMLDKLLRDPISAKRIFTPGNMRAILQDYIGVFGVRIETWRGDLRREGALHWIAMDSAQPEGIWRGWVRVYNPFPNQMQRYGWHEFSESAGALAGVFVERKS